LYEPASYLSRCLEQCLNLNVPKGLHQHMKLPLLRGMRVLAQLFWHQGFRRPNLRRQFWQQLWTILRQKPQVLSLYLTLCLTGEHFWEYRRVARDRIAQQLGYDPLIASMPLECIEALVEF
jgi:Domain of unknown function (DUF4070)